MRSLLAESRARESVAARRLAHEAECVHTLEVMRLNGAIPPLCSCVTAVTYCHCAAFSQSFGFHCH
jgi:hypothetical protein